MYQPEAFAQLATVRPCAASGPSCENDHVSVLDRSEQVSLSVGNGQVPMLRGSTLPAACSVSRFTGSANP